MQYGPRVSDPIAQSGQQSGLQEPITMVAGDQCGRSVFVRGAVKVCSLSRGNGG
jgi:hypothetical protein